MTTNPLSGERFALDYLWQDLNSMHGHSPNGFDRSDDRSPLSLLRNSPVPTEPCSPLPQVAWTKPVSAKCADSMGMSLSSFWEARSGRRPMESLRRAGSSSRIFPDCPLFIETRCC